MEETMKWLLWLMAIERLEIPGTSIPIEKLRNNTNLYHFDNL